MGKQVMKDSSQASHAGLALLGPPMVDRMPSCGCILALCGFPFRYSAERRNSWEGVWPCRDDLSPIRSFVTASRSPIIFVRLATRDRKLGKAGGRLRSPGVCGLCSSPREHVPRHEHDHQLWSLGWRLSCLHATTRGAAEEPRSSACIRQQRTLRRETRVRNRPDALPMGFLGLAWPVLSTSWRASNATTPRLSSLATHHLARLYGAASAPG